MDYQCGLNKYNYLNLVTQILLFDTGSKGTVVHQTRYNKNPYFIKFYRMKIW